jgi:hypothetical protein
MRREKSLAPAGNQTPPAQPVTIQTELPALFGYSAYFTGLTQRRDILVRFAAHDFFVFYAVRVVSQKLMRSPVYVSPHIFFVFYAVRVVSKGMRLLFLPGFSCYVMGSNICRSFIHTVTIKWS